MNIRKALESDINQILVLADKLTLLHESERQEFIKRDKPTKKTYDEFKNYIEDENVLLLVTDSNPIVGFSISFLENFPDDMITIPRIYTQAIYVDSQYIGQKIGTSFMEKIEKWGKEKNVKVFQIDVWNFNKSAYSFYKRNGFEELMIKMEKVIK